MKVLVTGGAGYIGSHAVRELLRANHEVVVLDDLSNGHQWALPKNIKFVEGSTGDLTALAEALQDVEAVMHFAAFIEVGESVLNPGKYYANNFANGLTLLKAMRGHGVNKIVFSSSAAVYGQPQMIPIVESHPCQPINPDGRSKRMFELALEDFRRAHRLGYVVLRYFNVAGAAADASLGEAHDPESHLIPRVLLAALNSDQKICLFGTDYATKDGTCVRDYVHVEDLARAHVLALQKLTIDSALTYNLGSQVGFTVREVIDVCQRVTGVNIHVEIHARRPGDPAELVASSEKIRKELGWKPQYPDLETIIAHAWKWHKGRFKSGDS